MELAGQCLCGAVTVTAEAERLVLRACHCDMCRRHTSSMFISIPTIRESQRVDGPATSFRSSDRAERGFCTQCGSTLWYAIVETGERNLSAGLFPDAGGGEMKYEFFADLCPGGYALAGAHRRLNTDEMIALIAPNDGETHDTV